MPEVISYMPREKRRWRRSVVFSMIGVACLAAFVLIPDVTATTDQYSICRVCSSTQHQTVWKFSGTSRTSVRTSVLDGWIANNVGGHVHEWSGLTITDRGFFGGTLARGCSTAPPIYSLNPQMLADFIKKATATELTAFVQTMQIGTDAQQQQAVEKAADLLFGATPTSQSTSPSIPQSESAATHAG